MEKSSKTGLIIGLVALLVIGGGAFWALSQDEDNSSTNQTSQSAQDDSGEVAQEQDIVALASGNDQLKTLVTAVAAADLVETLQGEGPFTVFAPTDAAFSALPAGTLDSLLKPENKSQLSGILTYHVVSGAVLSSQLSEGQEIKTVQGGVLTVDITDGMVYLVDAKGGRAQVVTADVDASNGVVHVINSVLMP